MKPTFMIFLLIVFSVLIIFGAYLAKIKSHIMRDVQILTPTKTIRVTAYCPCEKCCGKWADGQTASGYWIQPGDRFVAAPKHIPFGTKFIVPGYNNDQPVEVKDRGGAITVERLDVFFGFDPNNPCDPHQKALEWGVKYLEVKIVKD